jgi:chromosome partitioning protein
MTRTMALANQKGGVGKTTSTINLAYALTQRGKSVLAVDLDPQASLTIAMGQDPRMLDEQRKTINYGLLDNVPLKDIILEGTPALIPASITLAKAEVSLVPRWNSVNVLKGKLREIVAPGENVGRPTFLTPQERAHPCALPAYDYLLIDCPPTLSLLTINGLVAADTALIPVKTDYLSLMGLPLMLETIEEVQRSQNPTLTILGVLPTMFKSRNSHDREALQEIQRSLEPHVHVFDPIAHSTAFDKSAAEGKSTLEFLPNTHGVENYYKLADYILAYDQ